MKYKIEWKDRKNEITCYLPEESVPDKNAVAELHQMTALRRHWKGWSPCQAIFREMHRR